MKAQMSPQAIAGEQTAIAAQVRAASTSFYGAMRILPAAKRRAIFAVYAFCRTVDDIADEDLPLAQKHRELADWRKEVARVYEAGPQTALGRELQKVIEQFALRRDDMLAVIDGMQMDADGPIVAPSREELELYCDRVACAVGRLCVIIFGEPNDNGTALANHLGMALQKTNILRDIDEDASIGRLYLPRELLQAHGIGWDDLSKIIPHPGFAQAWRELAQEAEDHFLKARQVLARCDAKSVRPARIMMEVYHRNLQRMRALSDAQLQDPACSKRLVGKLEKILIALRYGLF